MVYPALDPSHPLGRDDDTYPAIDNFTYAYQHLIGTLLFLQLCSRPDISFVILVLSQFCSAPLLRHYAIARRILRYLKGKKYFRLHSTLDFWYYRMGHPREPGRLTFLKFATDVSFITGRPLTRCKFCIFGKQARLPAPTSSTPRGRKPDISHLHVWGTRCFAIVMGYPPGERGYRNIPYNSIHSVLPSHLDAKDFPSCSSSPSTVPVPAAPPPPPQLQIAPSTPNPTRTHSRDPSVTRRLTEKEQISGKKIEADKLRLARVREAAAQRGGVLDMGVMDRRADRWMHERDYTAREFGTRRYALTPFLQNNSVVMPLDPTPNSLGRDGRSVVRISGYGLGRGQDRTSIDFGVYVVVWGRSNQLASEETKFMRISWGARNSSTSRTRLSPLRTCHRPFCDFSTAFSPPLPCFSPISAVSVRFSSSTFPRSPGFPQFRNLKNATHNIVLAYAVLLWILIFCRTHVCII